jgi:hypothetical protein
MYEGLDDEYLSYGQMNIRMFLPRNPSAVETIGRADRD